MIDSFFLSENVIFMSMLANEGFQHEMLKCYLSSLHIIALCVDNQGYSESIGRGREKPGKATPPNNSGHPEMLACDAVGGVVLRAFRVPEGGRIHSTPIGEGFQCWSSPVSAGHCSGQSLIAKSCASEDKM